MENGNILFTVLVDENNLETSINGIKEIIGDKGALSRTAVTIEYAERTKVIDYEDYDLKLSKEFVQDINSEQALLNNKIDYII